MSKIINAKDLPSNFPFESEATYSGKKLPILSEKDVEIVVKLDPCFKMRGECKEKIWKNFIGPFSMFLHKYLIYKDIFLEKRIPKNITIFSIIEDALKQSITDLARLMTSFIFFMDECNGKYSNLFRNKSERKLFESLIKGNSLGTVSK